ncbi:uncharacterized protein CLUP02_16618 [Colletotrichum lupini]|uniref:Uncharacterized protein n=1 Tax=Colletotrichum lupini TaxID=145971 RepID=A0A9Q8T8A3_9PEZI|nr:uncharacterized protein CLUP02_16618 [Colletotrichum lupini]UQC91084.1 hypothetical protein CLUP02_16618 [Colletotrichum lupini]
MPIPTVPLPCSIQAVRKTTQIEVADQGRENLSHLSTTLRTQKDRQRLILHLLYYIEILQCVKATVELIGDGLGFPPES